MRVYIYPIQCVSRFQIPYPLTLLASLDMTFIGDVVQKRLRSATSTFNGKPSISGNARLVASLGPVLPNDKVSSIIPPQPSEITWVDWKKIDGTEFRRPTIGAPTHGTTIEAYFPADTVRKEAATAVYTLAPGKILPGTKVPCKSEYILQHDLDLGASTITIRDPTENTRRGIAHGRETREEAYVTIANSTMAMSIKLPRGETEFKLTIDPSKTGKESMTGVLRSRVGNHVFAGEHVSHVYYKLNDVVTEWPSNED